MKGEKKLAGKIMREFSALIAEAYSYQIDKDENKYKKVYRKNKT